MEAQNDNGKTESDLSSDSSMMDERRSNFLRMELGRAEKSGCWDDDLLLRLDAVVALAVVDMEPGGAVVGGGEADDTDMAVFFLAPFAIVIVLLLLVFFFRGFVVFVFCLLPPVDDGGGAPATAFDAMVPFNCDPIHFNPSACDAIEVDDLSLWGVYRAFN